MNERFINAEHRKRIGGFSGIILIQLPVYFLNILTYMILKVLERYSSFFYSYDAGEKATITVLSVVILQILYGFASMGYGFLAIPSSIICFFILMNL